MCCAAAVALWTFVHDREGVSQRELPTERERKRVRERTKESDCCCMLACLDLEQKNQEEGDVGEKKRNGGGIKEEFRLAVYYA